MAFIEGMLEDFEEPHFKAKRTFTVNLGKVAATRSLLRVVALYQDGPFTPTTQSFSKEDLNQEVEDICTAAFLQDS